MEGSIKNIIETMWEEENNERIECDALYKKMRSFLKKIYELDKPDGIGKWEAKDFGKDTYFREKMVEFVREFGVENLWNWVPAENTNLDSTKLVTPCSSLDHMEKIWYLDFMMRIRILLFEIAAKEDNNIKDKKYYEKLLNINRKYREAEIKCIKTRKSKAEKGDTEKSEDSIEYLEQRLTELKHNEKTAYQEKTWPIRKIKDEISEILFKLERKYQEKIACERKTGKKQDLEMEIDRERVKELRVEKKNYSGWILKINCNKDYFDEFMEISLKTGKNQFPEELPPIEEEIYYTCKSEYNKNPNQEIEQIIANARKEVYAKM